MCAPDILKREEMEKSVVGSWVERMERMANQVDCGRQFAWAVS